MTLDNILEKITKISTDDVINTKNYMKSLQYISNLYNFRFRTAGYLDFSKVEFLPSFKDCYICEELGEVSFTEENELRLIKMRSELFFEDEKRKYIISELFNICTDVIWEDCILTCYLKDFKRRRPRGHYEDSEID